MHFVTVNQQILLYQEIQINKLYFNTKVAFSISFNFFESLRIDLMNMVSLMMSAKIAALGLLKIK